MQINDESVENAIIRINVSIPYYAFKFIYGTKQPAEQTLGQFGCARHYSKTSARTMQ